MNIKYGNDDLDGSIIGVWGVLADGAGISGWNSDESLLSPGSSPGVLDFPVVITDTDEEDTVVDVLGAVVEDSWSVGGPDWGIDGNWNGSSGKGVDEVGASRNISVVLHLDGSSLLLAGLVSGDVGVILSLNNTVVLDVVEGRVHPSSVAAHVSVWAGAVNQLLFGETDGDFSLVPDEDGAFEGGGGREGPAWSALSLILNISDFAVIGPVDVSVDGGDFGGVDLFVGSLGDLEGEVGGFEFSLGEVGELVDSHGVGVLGIGVVLVDGNEVSQEDVLSVCLLALAGVALSELLLVLFEGVDVRLAGRGTLQTV